MKGYKIDFTTNTITMNYKFAAAAAEYGTPEYTLIREIKKDFPHMIEIVKAGRTVKSAQKNKRLTYENMESHMSAYKNSAELLSMFEKVKIASRVNKSPYKYVCDWFKLQFPNYQNSKTFSGGEVKIIPITDLQARVNAKDESNEIETIAQ